MNRKKEEKAIIAFVKIENQIKMESDIKILEIAFSNLSEEFKEIRQQQVETNKALSDLKEKIEGFEQ